MADFVYLNVEPDQNKASDCVTRAISLVSKIPYTQVRKKLWLTAKLFGCEKLCKSCYSNFINNVLKYREVNCDGLTVEEFADLNPYGEYLIRIEGHLTAIINNTIYDIWDCREQYCDIAWKRAD